MVGAIVPTEVGDFLRSIPYEISGQWFHGKNIKLDGYSFSYCRFDACNIYVSRGLFRLDHCFMASCNIYYLNEANAVVRLFTGCHIPSTVQVNPYLRPR